MDMYGGRNPTAAMNGSHAPPPQWTGGPGDAPDTTGLVQEESSRMWGLGLGESETPYPQRAGAPDCAYYMRTGVCGYGSRCRFNHPPDRATVEATVRATGQYPERLGALPCQFYLKTGTCKFGASCKFNHPRNAGGSSISHVPLNIYGYPLRQGESECSYFLKTGQCKFGITCKFHHPHPAAAAPTVPPPASAPQFYPSVQQQQHSLMPPPGAAAPSSSLRPLLPASFMQGAYGPPMLLTPPPGVLPLQAWSHHYSAPGSPALSPGATSLYGVTQLSSTTPSLPAGVYSGSFPERPGEAECQYYLKTGDCKFGTSCKFHHPRLRVPPSPNCNLSSIGLPLRPGVQRCTFYVQNGFCKFGSTCKFDHPVGTIRYNPSASSLADAPVAPYPLLGGSSSSSAAELSDPYLSTSRTTSNNISAGLIFSQSGVSVPFTDLHLSTQTSLSLTGSRITRQGREIRRSF